jgi:hypothetical protein
VLLLFVCLFLLLGELFWGLSKSRFWVLLWLVGFSLSISRSVFCELPVLTDRIAVLPQQPCPISFLKLEEIGCFHRFERKLVCVHQGLMFSIVSLCPSGLYLCMCVCVYRFSKFGFCVLACHTNGGFLSLENPFGHNCGFKGKYPLPMPLALVCLFDTYKGF